MQTMPTVAKSGGTSDSSDGMLSSSYPAKTSGAFLSSLFKTRSRDSDRDVDSVNSSSGAGTPPVLLETLHVIGTSSAVSQQVKGNDKVESATSSWLHRKPLGKKKEKTERFKTGLFGTTAHAAGQPSKEVKGAVKVGIPNVIDASSMR
jgi:hypothetical protein